MTAIIEIARYNPLAEEHALCRVPLQVRCEAPLPIGFSYLVERESRRPLPEPFAYLLDKADVPLRATTGRHRGGNRTYAHDLQPFFQTLARSERPFRYVDDELVSSTLLDMVHGITRQGVPFKRGTIAQGLSRFFACVDHSNGVGTAITLDRDAALAAAWGVESMYDADGRPRDLSFVDAARRHMIRPPSLEARRMIEGRLLMRPQDWVPHGPSSRPGLEYMHGFRIGLRVVENLGVHVEDVMALTVVDPNREYQMTVRRTKGADCREAWFPGTVVLAQQAYVRGERAACVARAREVRGANWDEPEQLLLNGLGSGTHNVGLATQPSTIQADFRAVQAALGMMVPVRLFDVWGEPYETFRPLHCYHDLRHGYAYHQFEVAVLKGEADPIDWVRVRLGHRSLATTTDIYLFPDKRRIQKVGDVALWAVHGLLS